MIIWLIMFIRMNYLKVINSNTFEQQLLFPCIILYIMSQGENTRNRYEQNWSFLTGLLCSYAITQAWQTLSTTLKSLGKTYVSPRDMLCLSADAIWWNAAVSTDWIGHKGFLNWAPASDTNTCMTCMRVKHRTPTDTVKFTLNFWQINLSV